MRHELGERQRAELALGQLAVMLEGVIRQAGDARIPARVRAGHAFDGERVEVGHRRDSKPQAVASSACFLRSAHVGERDHAAFAEAMRDEPCRDGGGRRLLCENQQPRARRDVERELLDRAAVQREKRYPFERPGEPRGGERERGTLRDDRHLFGRDAFGKRRADAEVHRVAGREHADATAAHRGDRVDQIRHRRRPGIALRAALRSHGEMALAADQHLRRLDKRARGRREAGDAVLADADDRKPRASLCAAEDDGVQRGGGDGAAAAAAGERDEGKAEVVLRERRFDSAAPTKPTGKPSTAAGRAAPSATSSKQPEERGRRVADDDDRAWMMAGKKLHAGGGARLSGARGKLRRFELLGRRVDRMRRGMGARRDAGRDHADVAEDRRAGGKRRARDGDDALRIRRGRATTSGMPQACTMRAATGRDSSGSAARSTSAAMISKERRVISSGSRM